MGFRLSAAVLFAVFLGTLPSPVQAAQSKPAWELEWAQIVEAAKKEGQVTVYHTRGPFDEVFADFNKHYPGIKLVSVTGRGGELSSRIMAERRADKYLADIYMGSTGTPFDIDPVFSLREDVRPDPTIESYRPKPNDKFISVYRPEYRDLDAAFKVIDEVLKR